MAAAGTALEWRLLAPSASKPELSALPWALLALAVPLSIGVWAFEVGSEGKAGLKADVLWAVMVGTICMVALLLFGPRL